MVSFAEKKRQFDIGVLLIRILGTRQGLFSGLLNPVWGTYPHPNVLNIIAMLQSPSFLLDSLSCSGHGGQTH